jgi:hypothetical protein
VVKASFFNLKNLIKLILLLSLAAIGAFFKDQVDKSWFIGLPVALLGVIANFL